MVYQSGSYPVALVIWLPENIMPREWDSTEILIPAVTWCETMHRPAGFSGP